MWSTQGIDLKMCEGDFGLTLPISISGTELTEADTIKLTIKRKRNDEAILAREMTPSDNTVNFTLTSEETALFHVGTYVYVLDWYRGGQFMCNIIPVGILKVVDKA